MDLKLLATSSSVATEYTAFVGRSCGRMPTRESHITFQPQRSDVSGPSYRPLRGEILITSICAAFVTTYQCLIGVSKTIPGLGNRDMTWVHNKHLSWLIMTQPDQTYFFVHWKLQKQIRWPTRAKWSDEEAEKAAASVADHPISESLVFGELWRNRIRGHLIGLEEGLFDHWYYGRIVLVGDSVHKVGASRKPPHWWDLFVRL